MRVLLLLLSACTYTVSPQTVPPQAAVEPHAVVFSQTLSPVERWLIEGEDADTPMLLVEDDSPAGLTILHTPSLPADPADPLIQHLVSRMRATLEDVHGVGLAAPQVGIARRVILVQRLDQDDEPLVAYMNPAITFLSEQTEPGWEGCLSVPEGRGQVERPVAIMVAHDGDAGPVEEPVEGWTARIFQHEIDHLDGVLFTDKMLSTRLLPASEYTAMRDAQKRADEPLDHTAPVAAPAESGPHLEAPFPSAVIRKSTRVGRRYSFRVQRGEEPPEFRVLLFSDVDDVAATLRTVQTGQEPTQALVTWDELESHAWFPAETTERGQGFVDTAAGAFDAVIYTVTDEDGTLTRYWFANDLPGPPVRVEVSQGDTRLSTVELVELRPEG